jgi:hypothetical protein
MIKDLKRILEANDDLDEADFQEATQLLLTRQFLLRSKGRQRKAYDLVARNQTYFRDLMDAMNYQLVLDENQGYVGVVPETFITRMKLEESLLLMVLRYVYDQEINSFNVENDGSVVISIEDLENRYLQLTQREMPQRKSVFVDYMRDFTHRNIAAMEQDEQNPMQELIRIYPVIGSLLSGDMLERLAAYIQAEDIPVTDMEVEDEEE